MLRRSNAIEQMHFSIVLALLKGGMAMGQFCFQDNNRNKIAKYTNKQDQIIICEQRAYFTLDAGIR